VNNHIKKDELAEEIAVGDSEMGVLSCDGDPELTDQPANDDTQEPNVDE
jgi:hypothetical protein